MVVPPPAVAAVVLGNYGSRMSSRRRVGLAALVARESGALCCAAVAAVRLQVSEDVRMIDWKAVPDESYEGASAVVERWRALGMKPPHDTGEDAWLRLLMDLQAVSLHVDLDWEALSKTCAEGDLAHDLAGIQSYIDRETGALGCGFTPRCTRRAAPVPHRGAAPAASPAPG